MSLRSDFTPVFLLGAGRSGTKFLRSLLSVSEDVNVIPFDVGYVWRYKNERVPHDEFTKEMATEDVTKYVRKTLPTLVCDKHKNAKILIEKSVPNSLRPEFVHAIYPDAKFIHLIRDGRAVTESAIRLWKEPTSKKYLLKKLKYFPWSNYRYGFWYLGNMVRGKFLSCRGQQIWGPRYIGMDYDVRNLPLESVCARQWKKCIETCSGQLKFINPVNVLEVRYENLVKDHYELLRIGAFLGLSDIERVVKEFEATCNIDNLKKWEKTLDDYILHNILKEIEPTLTDLGYL